MVYGDGVYGDCGPYGEDCGPAPAPYDSTHCHICGEGWRVEATELSTGVVKAVLHPIGMEWEEAYSRPSSGSITVATEDPKTEDVWPKTGIYISRVFKDGSRQGYFGGYFQAFNAGSTTPVGFKSIDEYLFNRLLANENEGISYSTPEYVSPESPGPGLSQTEIAKQLVEIATTGRGYIPLIPVAQPSSQLRVRHWDPWEYKNIGEAIDELTKVENGVKYRLVHTFFENPARWETRIVFMDEDNIDRGVVLRGDFEAWKYGLQVDGKNQADRIFGVGSGEGEAQMFSVAYDADADLPEFQATKAWKDVSVPATLDAHTIGAVTENRDPASTPSIVLVGLKEVPPEKLLVGDIVESQFGYGLTTFRDQKARVDSIAWRLQNEEPVNRTLGLEPLIRPKLSIKTQTPAKAPVPTTPEQGANPPAQTPIAVPAPQYPSQVFDLSVWKLTLPTGSSGHPDEIKQPALNTYSSDYFKAVDGPGVKFKAPQKGVTTPNSKNTRSELREMKPGGKDNASWSSGTMEAELAFTHLPASKPHVVGMQVHDSDDDISVLRLEGSDLWLTNGDNTHGKKILTGYNLGDRLKVKLVVGGGKIKWYLGDNPNPVYELSKKVSGGYFKAGAYQQAGNSGPDYGEVIIYKLKVTH